MAKVFLVRFDVEAVASVAAVGGFEPVDAFAKGVSGTLRHVGFAIQRDSATKKRMPAGDFLGLSINSHYGLVSTRARSWLGERCKRIRFSPIAPSKGLSGFEAFSVDNVLEDDVVDMQKSDITIEETGMWRAVRLLTFKRDLGAEGFFRLKERSTYLLCTDPVVDSFRTNSFTGLKFAEVSPVHHAPQQWYSA